MPSKIMPPQEWGNDTLSSFLESFRRNQWVTFNKKCLEYADLADLDRLLDQLLKGAIDPDPFVPIFFLQRAHSAYRASVNLVMGGQLHEAQATLRLCLEHASYGYFIGSDNARWTRWLQRNDSKKNKEALRKEFTSGKIRRSLKLANSEIGENFDSLYEILIDAGAHPNELGFSMSILLDNSAEDARISSVYLHGDGVPLDFALKMSARVAICILEIAYLLYPARMGDEGIRHQLNSIKVRY